MIIRIIRLCNYSCRNDISFERGGYDLNSEGGVGLCVVEYTRIYGDYTRISRSRVLDIFPKNLTRYIMQYGKKENFEKYLKYY